MKEKNKKNTRKTSIGGQALIEGIMMRGPAQSAMAVRRPNGEIYFEEHDLKSKKRPAFFRLPIIRGIFGFVDSITTGYKYLMRSADIAFEEITETTPDPAACAAEESAKTPAPEREKLDETADGTPDGAKGEKKEEEKGGMFWMMVIAAVLGVALAIGLFVWLPTFLYSLLAKTLPEDLADNRFLRSAFEGVLKIAILVLYMAAVSLMKDMRRTFMYHGAEHKTIFCYEHGMELTVENVRGERRFHPRCGTSFLILMLLVSIVAGMFIPTSIEGIGDTLYTFIRAGIKILLIPIVMGVGYELLKFAGRHDNILTRIISAPGMWLQRITVKEPTDDMIECAILAFKAVMPEDESDNW